MHVSWAHRSEIETGIQKMYPCILFSLKKKSQSLWKTRWLCPPDQTSGAAATWSLPLEVQALSELLFEPLTGVSLRERERDDRDCFSFGSYSSKACWWTEPGVSEMEADSSRVTLRPHIHFLPKVLPRHINPAIKLEAYHSPSFTSVSWRKGLILPPSRQCNCTTNQRIRCLKPITLLPLLRTEWPVSCGKTSPYWQTEDCASTMGMIMMIKDESW